MAQLGGGEFWRLRLGFGHPRDAELAPQEVVDYVLHPPRSEERPLIDDAIERALGSLPTPEPASIRSGFFVETGGSPAATAR